MRRLPRRLAGLLAVAALGLPPAHATQPPLRPSDVTPTRCVPGETPDYIQRLLHVYVNNSDSRSEPLFLQRPCGALLARREDLKALRIRVEGKPTVLIDGEPYVNLNDYDGLRFQLAEAEQRLSIDGEPSIFYPTVLDLAPPQPPPPQSAAPGGFLNYGVFAADTQGQNAPSYSASAGLGLFAGESILLSDWVYFRQADVGQTYRLDTTWVHDDVPRMSTWRVGDVITRGSEFGGGAAVGGVQYGTNFATHPNLSITPVQILDAATHQSAAIGLYMNPQDPEHASRSMYLSSLTTVPHGPVELINVPTYNNGEYELVLRDSLGREMLVRQEFFFNAGLLREGLHDFSYEAGARRVGYAGDNYGGWLGSATHRYGFSNTFTGEAQASASDNGAVGGATGLWALRHLGVLGLTGAASTSQLVSGAGALGAVSLENHYDRYAYALREDCQNAEFLQPTADAAPTSSPVCRSFAAFSVGLPRNMNAGISAAHVDNRGADDADSARVSLTARPWPLAQLTLFGGWTHSSTDDVSAGLLFSMSLAPLSRAGFSRVAGFQANRSQLSATAFGDQHGVDRSEGRLSTGSSLGDTAVGVQAASSLSGVERESLTLTGAAPKVNVVAGVQSDAGLESYAGGATGAVAWLDHRWMLTRPLYSSFALVELGPDNPGVRVNGLRSDEDGDVLVSPLQAYAANPVSISGADLPMNARVDDYSHDVTPRFRSGVVVRPRIERVRDAMLTVLVHSADGAQTPIPPGAFATRDGSAEQFPAGEDGAIYVAGLSLDSTVTVTYRGQSCQLKVTLPAEQPADEIPELGPYVCEGVTP